jgi:formylglycine-generating enzyme required for sulfatase activity
MPQPLFFQRQWEFQLVKTRADTDEAHARALVDAGELEHAAALLDTCARGDRGRFVPMLREVLDQLEIRVGGVRFRYVPAARVSVGDDVGEDDERPARVVDVPAFWMAATPLLVGQTRIRLSEPDTRFSGFLIDGCAVVAVSWENAAERSRRFTAEFNGVRLVGRLPFEREWERAARGGLEGQSFVWGDAKPKDKHPLANIWQGVFPSRNTADDGFQTTAPVKSFQPNGYGLYDMAGNAWEWTADWYDRRAYQRIKTAVTQDNPTGPSEAVGPESRRTQRGGSFMCHESYCARYRPSSRQGAPSDIGTSHSGFRCAQSSR